MKIDVRLYVGSNVCFEKTLKNPHSQQLQEQKQVLVEQYEAQIAAMNEEHARARVCCEASRYQGVGHQMPPQFEHVSLS